MLDGNTCAAIDIQQNIEKNKLLSEEFQADNSSADGSFRMGTDQKTS